MSRRYIDKENLCKDCTREDSPDDNCGECLSTALHDMIHGNDYSYVPDNWEQVGGPRMVGDDEGMVNDFD